MNKKAICLISGGLDSILAINIIKKQGIECLGISFKSPFFSNKLTPEAKSQFNFPYREIDVGNDFFEMLKKPHHGYGSALNPCIDCKIYIMRKAHEIMLSENAGFIVSGEVLGQRPMSQHRKSMDIIEKQGGIEGLLVRPLCAKLFPPTKPETEGILDRNKLYDINGRTRKPQFDLAKELGVSDYTSPAGGCLLTEKVYANKLEDLFEYNKDADITDTEILKYGRHFRYEGAKIIVGRNDLENNILLKLKEQKDVSFFVPQYGSPLTLLKDVINPETIRFAAELTAFYSDCRESSIKVETSLPEKYVLTERIRQDKVDKYNINLRTFKHKR